MGTTRLIAAFLLAASLPLSARADDYLLVFSAEAVPYRPGKAHTFAAVARVESAPGQPVRVTDLRSLSWLPASGNVRPLALRPEVGRNVPLDETIAVALARGERVTMWGPYRIQPEFADAFRARADAVEAGFAYKAASRRLPPHVCDCVRSIEEMVAPRRYIGIFGYGSAASSVIVQAFSPWLVEQNQAHPWVASLIGLDTYPMTHRSFGDFTTKRDQARAAFRR